MKGIDNKFVHYGIRKDDLAMIATLCEQDGIDFDWLSEEISRKIFLLQRMSKRLNAAWQASRRKC
ncbi:MAG: hypothetical protein IJ626_03400 [Muribaculaceae bacterium]|nr:hypothetical protein [Muribaculaceae bacterium]